MRRFFFGFLAPAWVVAWPLATLYAINGISQDMRSHDRQFNDIEWKLIASMSRENERLREGIKFNEELRETIGLVIRMHDDARRRAEMARMGMPHAETIPPQSLPIPKWAEVAPKPQPVAPECCH